jgi:hypothetical protein
MNIAAAAGIAPPVHYTSTEDRLAITGFITEVPFPAAVALEQMPGVLRTLHALPPFPKLQNNAYDTTARFLLHQGPARDGFFQKLQAGNVLPKDDLAQLLALHAQLAATYPLHDADMVSSHNDLFKPDNILYDAYQHVWLVDWEAAFLNNRYIDLAVIANPLVATDADEVTFLERYFGQAPSEYQRAQFFVMRQIVHMFYAFAYFFVVSRTGEPLDFSAPLPPTTDFLRGLWSGEITLTDQATKTLFARVHLQQLFQNAQHPRFSESIRLMC